VVKMISSALQSLIDSTNNNINGFIKNVLIKNDQLIIPANKKRGLSPIIPIQSRWCRRSSLILQTLSWLMLTFASLILTACATIDSVSGVASWREEIELHDGSRIIVNRIQKVDPYGRREPFRPAPIGEVTSEFIIPGTGKAVIWKSEYGISPDKNGLTLVALDIVDGVPYVATTTSKCHDYNKWGRPNPPYVFFKHEVDTWQRISIEAFPEEIHKANMIVGSINKHQLSAEALNAPYISLKAKKYQNNGVAEYKLRIIRKPITYGTGNLAAQCEEMIYYKCGWISPRSDIGRKLLDRSCK